MPRRVWTFRETRAFQGWVAPVETMTAEPRFNTSGYRYKAVNARGHGQIVAYLSASGCLCGNDLLCGSDTFET